jgi:FtsP/CotA-like multicopper oxidase with cupredoxin domain
VSFADGDSLPASPRTSPFIDELPLPGLVVDVEAFLDLPDEYLRHWVDPNSTRFFKIASEQRVVNFHSQLPPTTIWGYKDLSPIALPSVGAGSGQLLPFNVLGPTIVQLFGDLGPPRDQPLTCASTPVPFGGGFVVRHINCLPSDHKGFGVPRTTIHLHGGHHLARADGFPVNLDKVNLDKINLDTPDGFPQFIVMEPPGWPPNEPPSPVTSDLCPDSGVVRERQRLDYYYPILDPGELDIVRCASNATQGDKGERPSTQWYHDHLLDFTGPNAYRGLAGFVLCFDELDSNDENDPNPLALRLPSAPYDIPLALQDKRFAADGSLVFSTFDHDGFLGDKFLVNGAIQPYLEVKRRKYRFRFLNASNARIYRIFFNDGNPGGQTFPMDMIATEGGLLTRPLRGVVSFMIAMAERYEMVIDFSKFSTGTVLYLENRLPQSNGRKPDDGLLPQGSGNKLLQFRVTDDPLVPDNSQVPDVLRPCEPISQAEIARAVRRSFKFERSDGAWVINGRLAGDLDRPIATPKRGQPEIWHLENSSGGWWHPIHIHSEFFRVLGRNGAPPSITARNPVLAERDGLARKDTILLKDGDSVDVFLRFRDHLGPFVFHCHNMEHEDMAMMARFDVVP